MLDDGSGDVEAATHMGDKAAARIAETTAARAFAEAAPDSDSMTFEEFKEWYSRRSGGDDGGAGGSGDDASGGDAAAEASGDDGAAAGSGDDDKVSGDDDNGSGGDDASEGGRGRMTLRELRWQTGFGALSASQVLVRLSEELLGGADLIERPAFERAMLSIVLNLRRAKEPSAGMRQAVDAVYNMCDVEGTGVTSFSQLASVLTIICGGSHEERVRAAFVL